MKNKKAQAITPFILIGLLILGLASAYFFMRGIGTRAILEQETKEIQTLDEAAGTINVEDCIKRMSEYGIYNLGLRGTLDETSEMFGGSDFEIAYGYTDKNVLPSLEQIQDELSLYVENTLSSCVDMGIGVVQAQGFEVKAGDINVDTIIAEEDIQFMVDYPITVRKGGDSRELSSFTAAQKIRFKKIHDLAETIIRQREQHKDINLSLLGSQGIDVFILTYDDAYVYVLQDDNSMFIEEPFLYAFAVRK